MAYTRLTAAEAAAMIKDQDNIGLSGFTPNGVPKATFRELSKRAIAEHEAGRPFQVGILTGASTSQSIEGDMAAANAIKFRAPFSTNKDFRTHTNMGEIDYEDMHLGHMAERLRRGFYGEIDLAIIEVSDLEEGETTCKAFLTSAGDRTDGTQRCRLPGIRPEEGTYSSTVPAAAKRCGSHFECCSGGIRTKSERAGIQRLHRSGTGCGGEIHA